MRPQSPSRKLSHATHICVHQSKFKRAYLSIFPIYRYTQNFKSQKLIQMHSSFNFLNPFSFRWIADEWGQCNQLCGGGKRQRAVVCAEESGGNKNRVPDEACSGIPPRIEESCNTHECPKWVTSDWSGVCIAYDRITNYRHSMRVVSSFFFCVCMLQTNFKNYKKKPCLPAHLNQSRNDSIFCARASSHQSITWIHLLIFSLPFFWLNFFLRAAVHRLQLKLSGMTKRCGTLLD